MRTKVRSYPRRPITRRLPTLPPLEMRDGEVVCPHCGSLSTLQHVESTIRWWNLMSVLEDGTLDFDGSSDTGDDGWDQNISCWSCGSAWDWASSPEAQWS